MKYLSPAKVNNLDKATNDGVNNYFQFVNSVAKPAGINITSNKDKTEVAKGGYPILTTDMGSPYVNMIGYTRYDIPWKSVPSLGRGNHKQ